MRSVHTVLAAGVASVVVAVALGNPPRAEAQFRKGLTQQKTEVTLNRKHPPTVLITGTAIKVEVVSQTNGRENIAQRFKSTVETRLLAGDARLRVETAQPDTLIMCTISRLDTKQSAGQRQVQVSKKTGTKQVWNAKKKAYETQDVYSTVNETQHFTAVQGDLAVAVQVQDRVSGASIDSQSFTPTYTREFLAGTTPPDQSRVEQLLIDSAVEQVMRRLTPTTEPVTVMLARPDAIDEINKLGQAGLWNRMLEQLEQIPPLKDPKKEAYRLFNLGVAREAMAYSSEDIPTSKKLLEQASSLYGRAIEMKVDEKYFQTPQIRIQEGIAAYAQLERQQAIIAAAAAAKQAADSASSKSGARALTTTPPATTKPAAFGNKDVVELVAGGLDEASLLDAIKNAKTVAFDLSPEGYKQLLAGKVSAKVMAAIRARQATKKAPLVSTPSGGPGNWNWSAQ